MAHIILFIRHFLARRSWFNLNIKKKKQLLTLITEEAFNYSLCSN